MFKYKFLDLPQIPKEIIDTIVPGEVIMEYPARTCTKNNTAFNTSTGIYYQANAELDAWVRANIPGDIDFVGIRYQFGSPIANNQGAHTDATRDYGILYVVDNAGGHVEFWQKKDNPLEFDERLTIVDYDELVSIETVPTPNGSWYLVNGKIIHSVEGITSKRITVQINLKSLLGIDTQ
jgi:hypothetical protein